MADDAAGPQFESPVPPGVRAQLLATEHWGLLAARGTAQSEVLSRISIFLTLVSAGLVSLALVGQATDFSDAFIACAIVVLAFIELVGALTQIRVLNIGMEDLMYVLAMNRLRGAYAELDPGIEQVFMSSPYDDYVGVQQTYYFLTPKRDLSQFLGSTMLFIILINSMLLGLLGAAVTVVLSSSIALSIALGLSIVILFFVLCFWLGNRHFRRTLAGHQPLFPSPAEPVD
ncbi:hypothetical protein ACLRGF_13000 [Mycetocola zhadangensis]|uniref:hypothetical protein n=1 Tax=Mycetocola zhadangensis TaxID=1164595 RepID=UPI003A4D35D5